MRLRDACFASDHGRIRPDLSFDFKEPSVFFL
jgi:hypothetical protein